MLINRAYVTGRAGSARILAAVAAAMLIAGCGGGGGGTPSATSSAPATPTPVVSGSGAGIGETGAGSGVGTAAGSVSGAATGSLSSGKTGSLTKSSIKTSISVSHTEVTGSLKSTQLMTPSQVQQAQQQANQPAPSHTTTAPTHTVPPPTHTVATPPPSTSGSNSSSSAPPQKQPSVPKTKVIVIHRTRVVTLTRTRTITKTITQTVAPKVPAGAYMPSKKPELAQHVFTIAGANLGCVLATTGVRCGVIHKSWTSPAQPKSCNSTWGSVLSLATHGVPTFSCGGSDPVNKFAKVIPAGWDTTVGDFTCQVRSFAVDCFNSTSNSGFTISRTGYSIY